MSLTIESRLGNIERELKEVKRKMYLSNSKKSLFVQQDRGQRLTQRN